MAQAVVRNAEDLGRERDELIPISVPCPCLHKPSLGDVPLAALLQVLTAVWDPGHTAECRQGLHGRGLPAEFSQQGFRLLQVRRGKPFCKPVIDRRQK